MLTEITSYLQLSNVSDDTFIFASKDAISDINFVYSEILLHYFKSNYTVILLNFEQSYAHYNHTFLKAGINVRQLREKEQFIIIDGLSEIEKITNLRPCKTEQNTMFRTLFSNFKGAECTKQLFFYIKEIVQKLNDESKPFVLLVDDISSLLNLGLDLNSISLFVQYCRSLCSNNKSSRNVLLIGSFHESKDPENNRMVNYLLHLADIKIQVEGLKTGYSKDVHGKITFNVRKSLEDISANEKFLFKVSEEGVKLLTLGL